MKILRAWDSGRNRVRYLYRNPDTSRVCVGEESFQWFFYVKNTVFDKNESFFEKVKEQGIVNEYDREHTYTKVFVDREHDSEFLDLNCNYVWEYRDKRLNYLRKLMDDRQIRHCEADLDVTKRWILTKDVQYETDLRVLFLDIETDDEKASGQPIPGQFRILSVAFLDGQTGTKVCIVAKDNSDEAECDLLQKLAKVLNGYDVFVAWNGLHFDFEYIKNRFMIHGIQIDWRRKFLQDHLQVFKKLGPALQSYALDFVGKHYLGRGKIDHGQKIFQLFKYDRKTLREYNLEDCQIMYDLEQKTKFLSVARQINNIGLCPCDDMYISRKIDNLILKQSYIDGNYHFRTKERKEEVDQSEEEKFKGAFVFEPVPGLYSDVKVFDFSSLYPNTIITFNLSPDTIVESDDLGNHEVSNLISSVNGYKFRKDVVGVLPKMVRLITTERNKYKKLMATVQPGSIEHKTYDCLQYAWKSMGLSFYGCVGNVYARFYDVRIAEAITLGGQRLIKAVADFIQKKGMFIKYGDSVTADRMTTVVYNGHVHMHTFEELWEMSSERETILDKERGKFSFPIMALSYNFEKQKTELNTINEIIRHKCEKDVYVFRCRGGVTNCTEDHSLLDENGNPFKPTDTPVEAKKIEHFSYRKWEKKIIDLGEYIPDYTIFRKRAYDKVLQKKDDKIFFCEDKHFDRYLDISDVEKTKSLLRLMAHYICNGSSSTQETTKSRFGASIASDDPEIIDQLKDDYNKWFHGYDVGIFKPTMKKREDLEAQGWNVVDKSNKLQMMNVLSAVILRQLCGQKAYGKKIPDFVYMLDLSYQKFFLEELIKGDGSYVAYKHNTEFKFETSSLRLTCGINLICSNLKYKINILYKENAKTYKIASYSNAPNDKSLNRFSRKMEYSGYVYDLNVANTHNFVDSCGNILLHNTDSIFVVIEDDKVIPSLISEIHTVCEDLVKKTYNCDNSTLEMAYDKGFKKFLILAKKRYAGYLTYLDGHYLDQLKLYVAGLEYKRTDVCQLLKKKQEELLKLVLSDTLLSNADARNFIDKLKGYVFSDKIQIGDIQIGQKITKSLDDYEGRQMNKIVADEMVRDGKEVYVGDKILYYIERLNSEGKPVPRPIYQFDGRFDRVYYWNNKIYPGLMRILEVTHKQINWKAFEFKTSASKNGKAGIGRMDLWD